jgi:hypothetical protein
MNRTYTKQARELKNMLALIAAVLSSAAIIVSSIEKLNKGPSLTGGLTPNTRSACWERPSDSHARLWNVAVVFCW